MNNNKIRYEAEKEQQQKRILEQVRKSLDELFPSKICKFAKVCAGYRKEAYTCQREIEACTYCGLYKRHEAQIHMRGLSRDSLR